MDMNTVVNGVVSIIALAATAFGILKWIGTYKQKLKVAQAALTAVKVGADGALQLLTEVIAASDKNTLTATDVGQIISTASDIPAAIKTALKISAVNSTIQPAVQTATLPVQPAVATVPGV
jgi:hypothetical protein